MASLGQSTRSHRRLLWAAAGCLPAGVIVGGIIGAWSGSARIGVLVGAAVGLCATVGLLAALAVAGARRA